MNKQHEKRQLSFLTAFVLGTSETSNSSLAHRKDMILKGRWTITLNHQHPRSRIAIVHFSTIFIDLAKFRPRSYDDELWYCYDMLRRWGSYIARFLTTKACRLPWGNMDDRNWHRIVYSAGPSIARSCSNKSFHLVRVPPIPILLSRIERVRNDLEAKYHCISKDGKQHHFSLAEKVHLSTKLDAAASKLATHHQDGLWWLIHGHRRRPMSPQTQALQTVQFQ